MLRMSRAPLAPTSPATAFDRCSAQAACAASGLFIAVFAVWNYAGTSGLFDGNGLLIGRDFVVFWTAAALTLGGQVQGIFDLTTFHALQEQIMGVAVPYYPWLYPPHYLFWILPLGLLPYLWAYLAWAGATLAAYLWAARRALGAGAWLLPALLLAPATFTNLLLGQNGFLTAALLVGGFALLDRRPVLAGILLGLLSFKPHLGLLVPVALAAAGQWRSFAGAAATVAAMAGLSLAAFGIEAWSGFLTQSTANHAGYLNEETGWYLDIVVTPYLSGRVLGLDLPARLALQALLALGAAAAVWLAFRRPCDRGLRTAVILAATFLASPFGYNYDLPLVTVALILAYRDALRSGFLPGERFVFGLVWFLPFLVPAANPLGLPIAPPVLLAFLGLLTARTLRVGAAAPAPLEAAG